MVNRSLAPLLLALMASTVPALQAGAIIAGKTYYAPRTEQHHSEREWALDPLHTVGEKRGMSLSGYGFYTKTRNKKGMGIYFGGATEEDNSDADGTVQIVREDEGIRQQLTPTGTYHALPTNALYGRHIDHMYDADYQPSTTLTKRPMASVLTLRPEQERVGGMLAWRWHMRSGWQVSVQAPITRVKNKWNIVENDFVAGEESGTSTPLDYFVGAYEKSIEPRNVQTKLLKAKLYTTEKESKTSLGDVKVQIGTEFFADDEWRIAVSANVTVPFGARDTGEFLFAPISGNNHHVGAGVGVQTRWHAWQHPKKPINVWLSGSTQISYLFQARETRTLGLQSAADDRQLPWLHYALGGEYPKHTGAFPLPNVLTRDVQVTPGTHWESTMGATMTWRRCTLSVGYQLFMRQREQVVLADAWDNDKYGAATFEWMTDEANDDFAADHFYDWFAANNGVDLVEFSQAREAVGPIQRPGKFDTGIPPVKADAAPLVAIETADKIKEPSVHHHYSLAACTTPDQLSHALIGSVGLNFDLKRFKGRLSGGVSYELQANGTKGFDAFSAWGGVSLTV